MNFPAGSKVPLFLEALEDRIAPAAVILSQGGNLLSAGDEGYLSLGNEPSTSALLVKVTAGKALVFWDAQDKLIKGVSVTEGIRMDIYGDVDGDIVTNLLKSGSLTDSDNNPANGLDGGKLLASSISSINVGPFIDQSGVIKAGNVGRIVAGGSVSNVNVTGALAGVFAGDGIFDAVATSTSPTLTQGTPSTAYSYVIGFDFDSSGPIDATAMTLTQANATFGTKASITHVEFSTGRNVQFFAGDGFDGIAGAKSVGGAITNVNFVAAAVDGGVTTDFFEGKAFTFSAGDGGGGTNAGGLGGTITNVSDAGTSGIGAFYAGNGGDGITTGGAGGKITQLDLLGSPLNYLLQGGAGGDGSRTGGAGGSLLNNNIAAVYSSQFITLAGDFQSDFTDGILDADERGFFVINRSSGEMVLVNGDTLNVIPPLILPQAANAVDALATDLNSDDYLDVVVAYGDGRYGILINDQADGFRYSVGNLDGITPMKVLAGDFLGDGGSPELVFLADTGASTTIKLFEVTNPIAFAGADPAAAFSSDPVLIKPFAYPKGGMVDAVGGSFPLATLGALNLNADESNDLIIAFGDGRLQGVYSTGSGTSADPYTFSVGTGKTAAPFATARDGIRDVDFNFAFEADEQRLAIVSGGGTKATIATIGPATLTEPATIAINKSALPMPDGEPVGTILQAGWTNSVLDISNTSSTSLALLTSQGSASALLAYDTSFNLVDVYSQDFPINGFSNNFLMTSQTISGEADSYLFTTTSPTLALAFQGVLPPGEPLLLDEVTLPFAAKTATLFAGDGGAADTGKGGIGGHVTGINLSSANSEIRAGDGGTSTSGAGGNGGAIDNAKTFTTAAGLTIFPGLSASGDLILAAGAGASVDGTTTAAKGGSGGHVKSLLVLDASELEILAGTGGSSKGSTSGHGGMLDLLTIYSAGDVLLQGGNGGAGTASTSTSGGKGGLITNIVLGTTGTEVESAISGNVAILAGSGGSTLGLATSAKGGIGGVVSGITANGITGATLLSGGGGGFSTAAAAGHGGAVSKIRFSEAGPVSAYGGSGGSALGAGNKGKAGDGGVVTDLNASINSSGYPVLAGGNGGLATGNSGGRGGSVSKIVLELNPSNSGGLDETLGVSILGGAGGNGTVGGHGGALSLVQAKGIYDEINGNQTTVNSIALLLSGGRGGDGAEKTGGNGGAVKLTNTFEGISHIDIHSANTGFLPTDEGLRVFGGDGGNGVTKSGNGGAVTGAKVVNALNAAGSVIPFNQLGGAFIAGGDGGFASGGAAGSGGAVSGLSLGVEGPALAPTGNVRVQAGDGGDSATAAGGVGGAVSASKLVAIKGNDAAGYAILVTGGNGGDGATRAGNGGSISNLTTTLPQVGVANTAPNIFSGVFLAGSGGDGTGAVKSTGGAGGHITGITQTQNVFSVMNLVQAGTGGDSSSDVKGGLGGNVSSVRTVGSIGAQFAKATIGGPQVPLGIYNTVATSALIESLVTTPDVQQGAFAGIGGTGLTAGKNGKVTGIKAQSIAAISAANLSGSFQQATTVSSITTLLLAYDINGNGIYDPGDGFVKVTNNTIGGLNTLNTQLISTAALRANTAPFIIP